MPNTKLYGIVELVRGISENEKITKDKMIGYSDICEYKNNYTLDNTIIDKKMLDKFTKTEVKKLEKINVHKGDIILPIKKHDHTPKYVNWISKFDGTDYVYNSDILCIRSSKTINSKFLFYILSTDEMKEYIDQKARNLKPNRINNDMIGNIEIEVPTLEEQEKIIKGLDEVALKRTELENQIKKYMSVPKEESKK